MNTREESTIKQDDFWRLINREKFIAKYFNARLQYRIPASDNGYVYIQLQCDDKTVGEHAEQYIQSYIDPQYTRSIRCPSKYKQVLSDDDELLNRIMNEYLVHIENEDKDDSQNLVFRSSRLVNLYLAIDSFCQAISANPVSDPSMIADARSVLRSLSNIFEREVSVVDEQDQFDEQEKDASGGKTRSVNDDREQADRDSFSARGRQEPQLKIAYPGAEPNYREMPLDEFVVKPKKTNAQHQTRRHHATPRPVTSDINDNELVREMHQKLKGRKLRDVIIDGANIGRTYGDSEFSARGIRLAVDLFQSYGYPDSKIVVILPPHYLSKDKESIFPDLIRRKIVHKAFHQKVDDKNKKFYDDRLIVDLAVIREGIILSNDFYRDLLQDSGEAVKKVIRERLLCYRFIGDDLCLPNPVSEGGLPLDIFLSK